MIGLRHITKTFKIGNRRRIILDDVTANFRQGINVGILGRNGAGKSTLMGIIGGNIKSDSGRVIRTSLISWPLGFAGCFSGSLTGKENLRFVSRIYNKDWNEIASFVEEFAELGAYMNQPISTYSSGMKAKLAFGLSMAIGFDYYLIDEVTAVGDASFKKKCNKVFQERKSKSTLIVVSHSIGTIKSLCDIAGVLDAGYLNFYDNIAEAIDKYNEICNEPQCIRYASENYIPY